MGIFTKELTCAICGESSSHTFTTSYYGGCVISGPDLDSRREESNRFHTRDWVVCCPHCGYCNEDISELIPHAQEIISTSYYKQSLNDKSTPIKANHFKCQSILCEKSGDLKKSFYSVLCAAWICDDEENLHKAKEFRLQAISALNKLNESSTYFHENYFLDLLMLSDLLRRIGQFNYANKICVELLSNPSALQYKYIIAFQQKLIKEKDINRYCLGTAYEYLDLEEIRAQREVFNRVYMAPEFHSSFPEEKHPLFGRTFDYGNDFPF